MNTKGKPGVKPVEIGAANKSVCVICGQPATQTVDGDPSCDVHVELVYEDQVENYTQNHLTNDEWLEKKS